jgi:hypothetical protein
LDIQSEIKTLFKKSKIGAQKGADFLVKGISKNILKNSRLNDKITYAQG